MERTPTLGIEIDLQTVFQKVTAQIEFLHIGADRNTPAQAFGFLGVDDSCTGRLRAAIERMQGGGYSGEGIRESVPSRLVSHPVPLSDWLASTERPGEGLNHSLNGPNRRVTGEASEACRCSG
jgi:hypothetical protein